MDLLLGGKNQLLDLQINFWCHFRYFILEHSSKRRHISSYLTRLAPVGGETDRPSFPSHLDPFGGSPWSITNPFMVSLSLLFEQRCVPHTPATKKDLLFLQSTSFYSSMPLHMFLLKLFSLVNICSPLNTLPNVSPERQLCVLFLPFSNVCLPPVPVGGPCLCWGPQHGIL